jgi:HEAT repeat protein
MGECDCGAVDRIGAVARPGAARAMEGLLMRCVTRCGSLFAILAFAAGCQTPGGSTGFQDQAELHARAEDLLLRAARGDEPEFASNAIEALVELRSKAALPVFRSAMQSPSPLVRFAGCIAAGEMRDQNAHSDVMRLSADPEAHVRLAAAFAGYRLGEQPMAAQLANVLFENPDENMRADAAYLIGRLGEPRAQRRLRAALDIDVNQKSNKVTVLTYGALAALGDSHAVDKLIGYAQGETVSRVLALQSLALLGNSRARDAFRYRMSTKEDYLENRLWSARGLGRLGIKDGYDLAIWAASYSVQAGASDDPLAPSRIRALAALALGDIGDERALPKLRELAGSDDPQIQVAACYAICKITAN